MLLPVHIVAGGLAIVLGAVALSVRKGGTIHRRAGRNPRIEALAPRTSMVQTNSNALRGDWHPPSSGPSVSFAAGRLAAAEIHFFGKAQLLEALLIAH